MRFPAQISVEKPPDLPPPPSGRGVWPRISIVMASYNQGMFIEESIRSILRQGYPNLELIIIDGGSTDNSIEIIKKYESNLAHWVSEPDSGQPEAINKGWRRSTGEFLAWMNTDDLYEPGVFFEAAKFMSDHPEVGVAFGNVLKVDAVNSRQVLAPDLAIPRSLENSLKHMSSLGTTAAFLRREVLDSVGYLNEELHYWMDPEFWIRIALKWKVGYVQHDWFRFRIHPNSKTTGSSNLVKLKVGFANEMIRVAEELYSRGDLPQSVKKIKPNVLSIACLRAAGAYADAGKREIARNHYKLALRYSPFWALRCLITRKFHRSLLHYFLGETYVWKTLADWRRKCKN